MSKPDDINRPSDLASLPRATGSAALTCRCGCGGRASYLCTGYDYDPSKPGGRGKRFVAEPCCINAMFYLVESAPELGLPPVVATPLPNNAMSHERSELAP